MNDRFSVLEEIRNINIGNEQTATISIGIGVGKEHLTNAMNGRVQLLILRLDVAVIRR